MSYEIHKFWKYRDGKSFSNLKETQPSRVILSENVHKFIIDKMFISDVIWN